MNHRLVQKTTEQEYSASTPPRNPRHMREFKESVY